MLNGFLKILGGIERYLYLVDWPINRINMILAINSCDRFMKRMIMQLFFVTIPFFGIAQTRPALVTPHTGVSSNQNAQKEEGRYLYEFGKVPTFADHDAVAAQKEAELPIRFPVLPLFQVSLDLPGYVDPLRRMSMLTFDAYQEDLDGAYNHPSQWAEDIAYNEFHGAEYGTEKVPVSLTVTTSASGDQFYLAKYRMESEGEWWEQWQMIHAESVEGGGVRLIKVVCHWPAQFAEMCSKEMGYYIEECRINPLRK